MNLRDRIARNLTQNRIGEEVEVDRYNDGSGSWIDIRVNSDTSLVIGFDDKGNNIESINAYKDIVQVVDHKKIF